MDDTIRQLLLLFQKADNDLTMVYHKLESEFHHSFPAHSLNKINPLDLVAKTEHLRSSLKDLEGLCRDVLSQRETLATRLFDAIRTTQELLPPLRHAAALKGAGEELQGRLERLSTVFDAIVAAEGSAPVATSPPAKRQKRQDDAPEREVQAEPAKTSRRPARPQAASAPAEEIHTRQPGVYAAVTAQELASVSTVIRGRAKLADINKLYEVIWKLSSNGKKCDALPLASIESQGPKVHGQTGDAKLNTLRSLGLITRGKGVVTLQQ